MIALPGKRSKLKSGVLRALPLLSMPLWIGAVLYGMGQLWEYEGTPSHVVASPAQWPDSSHLCSLSRGPTLVMIAHPCCPCTRASVGELARIMAYSPHPRAAYVLFYKPHTVPLGWAKTDLYARAAAIPGVRAIWDEDGREAERFHATTSGHTLLFDASGHLLYSGGITAGRGVDGDSPGQEALLSILQGRSAKRTRFPVFGCSLLPPQ